MKSREYITMRPQAKNTETAEKDENQTAFSDIAGNTDTIRSSSVKNAQEEADRDYAKKAEQDRLTTEKTEEEKLHALRVRENEKRMEIRNRILREEQKRKKEEKHSDEEIEKAVDSNGVFDEKEQPKTKKGPDKKALLARKKRLGR